MALAQIAEEAGVSLNFEAAAAGGIPIIKTLREALAGNTVSRVYGILNGTCNYILTRMEQEHLSFAECLAAAQRLGYAEADPSFDIEGHDTAHKLALLTAIAFGTEIDAASIYVEGIATVTPADIEAADELGYRIKLLGVASRSESGIEQRTGDADSTRIYRSLEKHYRDMQDLEFTIEKGKLWMLQTRSGKRTAKAALRIAVELANEGLVSREEAVTRVDPAALEFSCCIRPSIRKPSAKSSRPACRLRPAPHRARSYSRRMKPRP